MSTDFTFENPDTIPSKIDNSASVTGSRSLFPQNDGVLLQSNLQKNDKGKRHPKQVRFNSIPEYFEEHNEIVYEESNTTNKIKGVQWDI